MDDSIRFVGRIKDKKVVAFARNTSKTPLLDSELGNMAHYWASIKAGVEEMFDGPLGKTNWMITAKEYVKLVTLFLDDGLLIFSLEVEADHDSEGKLTRYVQDAVVAVEVRQMNSLQIYVVGMVKSPGRIILSANVNVLQALAIAGGPDNFASRSRIRIFRQEGGKTVIIPFDYDDVTKGKKLESNILLRRGDMIFVP